MKEPFVKHMYIKNKIYELRTKDKDGIHRSFIFYIRKKPLYYYTVSSRKPIRPPGDAINIAEKRMKEIISKA